MVPRTTQYSRIISDCLWKRLFSFGFAIKEKKKSILRDSCEKRSFASTSSSSFIGIRGKLFGVYM